MAKKSQENGFVETIKTIVCAVLLAGLFRTLFFQPFYIPSGSMKDELLIGDFLFVNKMAYGYSAASCPFSACPIDGRIFGSEPERGDIVVFRHPTEGTDYIKRLIGLPGDRVRMVDGRLFLNGQIVPREPVGVFTETNELQGPERRRPSCANRTVALGANCLKNRFIETLPNGIRHTVLDTSTTFADNMPEITVPAGNYFFMGDNRDNSIDSRVSRRAGGVGFVPFENLVGKANHVVFSSAGNSMFFVWTWRLDRFFVGLD